MFDHFQFTLIHGLNILGPYAILFFTASDFTYTTSHIHNWVLFSFGSTSSFFLELYFDLSPVARWAPSNMRSSSFSVISFCLFNLFMGFLRQEHWSGLPIPSPVHYDFSELCTSAGAQYATGDQWKNSRKNDEIEPNWKQHPVVDVTGDRSKVRCCKEHRNLEC